MAELSCATLRFKIEKNKTKIKNEKQKMKNMLGLNWAKLRSNWDLVSLPLGSVA